MNFKKAKWVLSTSPFLHQGQSTQWMMFQVIWALMPVFAAAYYFFGLSALLVSAAAMLGCVLTEVALDSERPRGRSLKNGSALITGLLLGLILPPGIALWIAFIGGVVAIALGKYMWGGLGQNIFNPALIGRAFLQSAFPTALTAWADPDGQYFNVRGANTALPFMQGEALDSVSSATPLASMKFDQLSTELWPLLWGNTGGSLGETSGLILVLAGVYLALVKVIDWRVPVSIIGTVMVFSGIMHLINPEIYPTPWFMVFSGGLLIGTVFMATDPVTSPMTPKGSLVFGVGIGFLVVLIRLFGGLPEGVMYAILLMNALVPFINRVTRQRVYGT